MRDGLRTVLVLSVILILLGTGCQYLEKYKPGTEVKEGESCDLSEEPVAEDKDEFEEQFEKLQEIVADMAEDEEKPGDKVLLTSKKKSEIVGEMPEEEPEPKEETPHEEPKEEGKKEETPPAEEVEKEPVAETGFPTLTVKEGDLVALNPKSDDKLMYSFSPPLDEEGSWQTTTGDAGEYKITITASDGKQEKTKEMLIIVEVGNQRPVVELQSELTVKEGEEVRIPYKATDAEEDELEVRFSGWMTDDTYTTTLEDAGEHIVKMTVSDGVNIVTKEIKIIVEDVNRKPVVECVDSLNVKEGELVKLVASASDPDGDEVTLSFEGKVNEKGEWQTEEGDAGEYTINVIASDGKEEFTKQVKIIIETIKEIEFCIEGVDC